MVTSHDRAFLNRVVKKVLAIEPGEVVFHHGNYDSYVLARQKRMEQLEASAKRQEKLIEKETKFINRFRSSATKASVVQSRIKKLGKIQSIVIRARPRRYNFSFPEPPHSAGRSSICVILKRLMAIK